MLCRTGRDAGARHVRPRYRDAELAADHAIHIIALVAGAAGAVAMVARAILSASLLTVSAVAVYSLALLAMLGASAAHNFGRTRPGNERRRRLHHAAIFVMIAGTYTPFTLSAPSGGHWPVIPTGATAAPISSPAGSR